MAAVRNIQSYGAGPVHDTLLADSASSGCAGDLSQIRLLDGRQMWSAWHVRAWRPRRGGLGIHGTHVPLFGHMAVGDQHGYDDRYLPDGFSYPEHSESRLEGNAA